MVITSKMKIIGIIIVSLVALGFTTSYLLLRQTPWITDESATNNTRLIVLPEPRYSSSVSIEETLLNRRSVGLLKE
jgi:hypothetical protein